jgi:beta-barrel assembly-enhancing protease
MRLLPGLLAALLLGGMLSTSAQPRPTGTGPGGRPIGSAAPSTPTTPARDSAADSGADDHGAIADALPTEDEVKLGREGAAESEREYKVINDPARLKRVETIGREMVAASQDPHLVAEWIRGGVGGRPKPGKKRVPFAYTFKILDSKEVNAFSLPGGPVYVTTGLLDYVQSDHELAAVLAHEVTHVAHHHMEMLIERQAKTEKKMLWVLLASILAGGANSAGFGNVLVGAQLYSIAKQNGYGREAERDADHTGVKYMLRTKYNPVGMLTVMKRFARDEARTATRDLGIFQSHPYPRERARLVDGYLAEAGIKVNLGMERDVSNAFRLTAATAKEGDREIGELSLNGQVILRVAAPEHGRAPGERADKIRRDLQDLFEHNLSLNQLRLSTDQSQVLAVGDPVITIYPADAAATGQSVPTVAHRVLSALQKALWKEQIDLTF